MAQASPTSPTQAPGATPAIPVLAVVGVGLIGGSFAAALRAAGQVGKVLGVGRQPQALQAAQALGLIDQAVSIEQAGRTADLILLATPVSALAPALRALRPVIGPGTTITDAGSTKEIVAAQACQALGELAAQFVPGHPIAGSHASGPAAAQAGLYRGRDVILTPLPQNPAARIEQVARAWQACGARVRQMSAAEHDAVFASVSHLPHWLAAAYMAQVALSDDAQRRLQLAGSGFRDFTRIAAGSPEMWRDIFISNKTAMLRELGALRQVMDRAEQALLAEDGQALQQWLALAAQARAQWRPEDD
ncbi:prephenate dehydrogenase/arogenate dehydrogenase family protein [Orrella sp. JC864]|uniref:prephenate dehydrogenase/arogenate dehydrogenase family protein n=1 Tax=Orrella sp. JC864 TaxID=3120298 RepID=UPI0012BD3488